MESNAKKAAFLREAQRVTGAPAVVHALRIENFVDSFRDRADAVTARALTSLKSFTIKALRLLGPETLGLFPKGQDVEAELTEAAKCWNISKLTLVPSRTDRTGCIVVVQGLERRRTV